MTDSELRELDVTIAIEVMGYRWTGSPRGNQLLLAPGGKEVAARSRGGKVSFFGYGKKDLPSFSTDIAAAWQVVEKLRADDWLVAVKVQPDCGAFIIEGSRSEYDSPSRDLKAGKGKVCCEAQDMRNGQKYRHTEWSFADTAPLAICRVALAVAKANPAASPAPVPTAGP